MSRADDEKFELRIDDEVANSAITSEVDELRIEKLSSRVTLISIMIPVLIVVVLIFAYLDMKKRVIHTKDTGNIGVQKLAQDLESRFSSLSLKQARLEEALAKLTDTSHQSLASIQVKIKKNQNVLKKLQSTGISKDQINTITTELESKLNNLSSVVEGFNDKLTTLNQNIEMQNEEFKETLNDLKENFAQIDKKMLTMDQEKIDKPTLDLALKLEALKTEQAIKARFNELDARLKKLEDQVAQLLNSQSQQKTSSAPANLIPPSPTAPAAQENSSAAQISQPLQDIEEQDLVQ